METAKLIRIINQKKQPAVLQPSTPVLDNFNRADAGTLGANWSVNTAVGAGSGHQAITGNQMYNDDIDWAYSNYTSLYWNPTSFNADQEVYMTIAAVSSYNNNDNMTLFARLSNPGGSSTNYTVTFTDAHKLKISKQVAGVSTTLDASVDYTPQNGDKLWLKCKGTTISVYLYRSGVWTLLKSVTDSDVAGGGYIGFYIGGNPGMYWHYDDFGGGNI